MGRKPVSGRRKSLAVAVQGWAVVVKKSATVLTRAVPIDHEGRAGHSVLHFFTPEQEIDHETRKEPGEGDGEERANGAADDETADDGKPTIHRSEPAKHGEGRNEDDERQKMTY